MRNRPFIFKCPASAPTGAALVRLSNPAQNASTQKWPMYISIPTIGATPVVTMMRNYEKGENLL